MVSVDPKLVLYLERSVVALWGSEIRQMCAADVDAVVDLHMRTFGDYSLTTLGRGFLTNYYMGIVSSQYGMAFVYERLGKIVGFIAGFQRPAEFYRELLRRRVLLFVWYSLGSVLRRPRILKRLLQALFYPSDKQRMQIDFEIASTAVTPVEQNRGIGWFLIATFLREARACGGGTVLLGVRQDDVDFINGYKRLGFVVSQEIPKPDGQTIVELALNL